MKSGKIRGPYKPACDICSRRRVKCDGDPGTVCPRCGNSGRSGVCSWDGYNARQKRGELFVDVRNHPDTEAYRKLLVAYHNYSNILESELQGYIQRFSLKDVADFRAHRPKDPDDLMKLSFSLEDFHLDNTQEVEYVEESDETESPTNIHLWPDKQALVYYGPCSPFRFRSDPLPIPSRFPGISENPNAIYVLQVIGDGRGYSPHFDWSRYLPAVVPLDRASHDKALDLFFKFCTPFGLRLIPDLFLKDMNQTLMVPRSQELQRSPHYSPMLHNVLVASALAFLDDPRLQSLETRRHYINAAKNTMDVECRKPTIAVVQALSLLGNFYGSQGEQGLGFIAFGQSVRVAQALSLHLDCSELVKRSLMDKSDQIDRNWATWSTFIIDVCWSLYVGREFAVVVPPDNFPLPYIDTAFDEMPVVYGNLPPQPNHLTKTFHANAELFIIGRDILEVNNALSKAKARSSIIFDRVGDIGVKLQTWYTSLSPDLQLPVSKSRSTVLAPHKLTLHLCYWWLVVLLHRPFFHHGASIKAGRHIDHVKICKRASDRIMEILKTWHEFFGLRLCPVTLIQIAFSAGTVYLLLAMRACSGIRVAKKELSHALEQRHLVTHYLQEIGRSWPGANKIADILKNLVQQRLKPRLDAIPVRNNRSNGQNYSVDAQSPPRDSGPSGRVTRRRSSSSKTRSPLNRLQRSSSRVSTKDSTLDHFSGSQNILRPLTTSPTYESEYPMDPVYNGSSTIHPPSNSEVLNDIVLDETDPFDSILPPFYIPTSLLFDDISSALYPYQEQVGQASMHVPSSSPPPYPNTGLIGVPAFESLLDEYLCSGDLSSATQPEPTFVANNTEDMDVSVDERDYWFDKLG